MLFRSSTLKRGVCEWPLASNRVRHLKWFYAEQGTRSMIMVRILKEFVFVFYYGRNQNDYGALDSVGEHTFVGTIVSRAENTYANTRKRTYYDNAQ